MSNTVIGLIHMATDEVTAAIGWVEMQNPSKAIQLLKLACGKLVELEARMYIMLKDLEGDLERHGDDIDTGQPPKLR